MSGKADQPRVEDEGTRGDGGECANKLHPRTASAGVFLTHSPAGVYRSLLFSLLVRATRFPMSTFLCRWILHTNLYTPYTSLLFMRRSLNDRPLSGGRGLLRQSRLRQPCVHATEC